MDWSDHSIRVNNFIKLIPDLKYDANTGLFETDRKALYDFADLIIREHLGIWELMDNGNKVEGYIEMEDYPKAVIKHFGVKNEKD